MIYVIANHRVHSFFKRINCTPRFPVWCPLLTSQGVFRPVKKPLGVQNVDMPTVEKRWRPRWSIPMAQCPTMESNSFWRNILTPFLPGDIHKRRGVIAVFVAAQHSPTSPGRFCLRTNRYANWWHHSWTNVYQLLIMRKKKF